MVVDEQVVEWVQVQSMNSLSTVQIMLQKFLSLMHSRVCALFARVCDGKVLTLLHHNDELAERTVHYSELHRSLHRHIAEVPGIAVDTQQTGCAL